jgi:hypothetical protein
MRNGGSSRLLIELLPPVISIKSYWKPDPGSYGQDTPGLRPPSISFKKSQTAVLPRPERVERRSR